MELRFKILFLYYEELHSDDASRDVRPREKIKDIDVPNYEVRAAQAWLIGHGYDDFACFFGLTLSGSKPQTKFKIKVEKKGNVNEERLVHSLT